MTLSRLQELFPDFEILGHEPWGVNYYMVEALCYTVSSHHLTKHGVIGWTASTIGNKVYLVFTIDKNSCQLEKK